MEPDERHPTLGHVHLRVRDLEPSVAFYRDVLAVEETERHGRYAFLTFGDHHHDVALQAVGPDAPGPSAGVGLYHVAFEVDSPGELRALAERLDDRGVQYSPVDHGISRAIYFDDPSGNGIEVYHDDRDARDQWTWDGVNRPFDPAEL